MKRPMNHTEKPTDFLIAQNFSSQCFSLLAEKLNGPLIVVTGTTVTGLNRFNGWVIRIILRVCRTFSHFHSVYIKY